MTVAELLKVPDLEDYVDTREPSPHDVSRRALATAALKAARRGDAAAYRGARRTLMSVREEEQGAYVLSNRDAREFNALVGFRDYDTGIDWQSVYDDPDL